MRGTSELVSRHIDKLQIFATADICKVLLPQTSLNETMLCFNVNLCLFVN